MPDVFRHLEVGLRRIYLANKTLGFLNHNRYWGPVQLSACPNRSCFLKKNKSFSIGIWNTIKQRNFKKFRQISISQFCYSQELFPEKLEKAEGECLTVCLPDVKSIKGGLILESFSTWLKSPKKVPNHDPEHYPLKEHKQEVQCAQKGGWGVADTSFCHLLY